MKRIQLELLERSYEEYVNKLSIDEIGLKQNFLELLELQDPTERVEEWKKMEVKISSIKSLKYLANPYFIGYGNPQSDILFLGKEKAFNIYSEPELFIHESVNNILLWKRLINQQGEIDHEEFLKNNGFNPMFPKVYFNKNTLPRHTWGIYSTIIKKLNGLEGEILNENTNYSNSFFNYCFLSELNSSPSKYSVGEKVNPLRKEFLKDNFFKSFSKVIIGAPGYLELWEIEEIFDVNYESKKELGKNKSRKLQADIYKSEKRILVVCSQLSGAAGWTTEALQSLVSILNE